MSDHYDSDYYLRGRETGKSLYSNYRWLPELTLPMAQAIVRHLGIRWDHSVLDFGCARGYLVRALREMGIAARGYDTSAWAVANCDPMVRDYVSDSLDLSGDLADGYDWVIAKDVLEHVEDAGLAIRNLMVMARVGVFAVVPLSADYARRYVVEEYEADVTHIHRWALPVWAGAFMRPGWSVTARYRVPGIKDNYAQYAMGNGFITARRIG